jgi:hypothetical protein
VFNKVLCTVLLLGVVSAVCAESPDAAYADPMQPYQPRPQAEAGRAEARYRVTSVLIAPTRRIAVINGLRCRVGDEVDGASVMSIEADAVRLRVGSRELVVRLESRRTRPRATEGDSTP